MSQSLFVFRVWMEEFLRTRKYPPGLNKGQKANFLRKSKNFRLSGGVLEYRTRSGWRRTVEDAQEQRAIIARYHLAGNGMYFLTRIDACMHTSNRPVARDLRNVINASVTSRQLLGLRNPYLLYGETKPLALQLPFLASTSRNRSRK